LKDNAVYEVAEECAAPQNRGIVSDSLIRFNAGKAKEDCPCLLRRVAVWDADNEREIVLLTNHPGFGAATIAAIYRDRWKIELFFKALKQNLRIKTFVGTSENALRIQIWTTLNRASPVQTAAPPLSSAVVASCAPRKDDRVPETAPVCSKLFFSSSASESFQAARITFNV